MEPAEKIAQEILVLIEASYKPTHNYVEVESRLFRHLDLSFYEQTTQRLCAQSFRKLADVEDTTLSASPGNVLMPVMIRSLVSSDGSIMASIYHPRIKPLRLRFLLWIMRKRLDKVVDMETEFTDGSFLVTSNAASAAGMDMPTWINAEFLPVSTSVDAVYQEHLNRLRAHLQNHPHITTKKIDTYEQLVASQNRMNALKAAFRGEIGGVSRKELERLSGKRQDLAAEVHAALNKELEKRKA